MEKWAFARNINAIRYRKESTSKNLYPVEKFLSAAAPFLMKKTKKNCSFFSSKKVLLIEMKIMYLMYGNNTDTLFFSR